MHFQEGESVPWKPGLPHKKLSASFMGSFKGVCSNIEAWPPASPSPFPPLNSSPVHGSGHGLPGRFWGAVMAPDGGGRAPLTGQASFVDPEVHVSQILTSRGEVSQRGRHSGVTWGRIAVLWRHLEKIMGLLRDLRKGRDFITSYGEEQSIMTWSGEDHDIRCVITWGRVQ